MNTFLINGGRALNGQVVCPGSKNSSLPIIAASLLSEGEVKIHNCPGLSDVDATLNILSYLGAKTFREGKTLIVDASGDIKSEIPENLMREMRSSIIFLGAVLGRTRKAEISAPGGCEIGLRPIDLHLDAMRKLGAQIEDEAGVIRCSAPKGLIGAKINLSFPSVGATENAMIAGCTARGETLIINAAREPEISDLADFLNAMGARISGAGESTIRIEGVEKLHSAEHAIIPDRIAAATFLLSGAVTGGKVTVSDLIPAHLSPVVDMLEQAGNEIDIGRNSVTLTSPGELRSVKMLRTMPYPGFPTDIQAPFCTMLGISRGTSVVIETIFESRYKYVGELIRFGAKIRIDSRTAVIEGIKKYHPANAVSPDLRGGAALVLAALNAEGESRIGEIHHIDRGYEALEITLGSLGADVKRID